MSKKLAGVCMIKNAISLDYCVEAAVNSLKDCCDITIVVYIESNDGTLELLKKISGIVLLICPQSDWDAIDGRQKLSHFQNVGILYANLEGYEYVLLCQADEVIHQDSIPYIKRALDLGEECYFVSRHNMFGSELTMLNVPQSRKPVSTVVCRLAKSTYSSFDDGESIAGDAASLDFINLIELFHMGFIRNNTKHIAKIKEMQGNIFNMGVDDRVHLKPEFDWKDWGFTHSDLVQIHKPLPKYVKNWIENLNK